MTVPWEALVGRRVVVRYRLGAGGPTDALGDLVEVSPTALVVRTARGDVRVARADVVAGRPVPPRPARAAPPHLALSVTDLVAVMARHWNPPDSLHLGGWWLRAAGGFTNRANCVVPLGPPGIDDDSCEELVRGWFARRGLPGTASIAGPADGGVPDGAGRAGAGQDGPTPAALAGALLRARGWTPVPDASAVVLVAPTGELRAAVPLPPPLTLAASPAPDAGWLAACRYHGQNLPAQAVDLLLSAPEQAFWSVRDGDRTVAVARGSLADGWAGVTAVEVDAGYRRRGLGQVLLAAIARWGWERGARSTYLQAAESNTLAQQLYRSAGFVPHHRYDYLREPAGR